MLTQPQIERLWESKLNAEARSCYFAEISSRESTIKRWITGCTFVLSSAAFVAITSKMPSWVSLILTALVAVANGYQIAVGQDGKIKTAGKLHLGWLQIEHGYDRLWSHTSEPEAETEFERLQGLGRELSETAATEIGHRNKLWLKWLDIVHKKNETIEHEHEQISTSTRTE